MDYLAKGCLIDRFQVQEFVSTKNERRPICLACWKSLKFVKSFEILGKQIHLGYCPCLYTFPVKLSSMYLFFSNSYGFWKKGQFFLAGKRS